MLQLICICLTFRIFIHLFHFISFGSFVNFSTNWFYEFEIQCMYIVYYVWNSKFPLLLFNCSMMSKSNEYFIHLSQLIDDQFTSESLNQCCCQIRRNSQRHYQSSSCLFMCLWIVVQYYHNSILNVNSRHNELKVAEAKRQNITNNSNSNNKINKQK